jgi:hypothetical protein
LYFNSIQQNCKENGKEQRNPPQNRFFDRVIFVCPYLAATIPHLAIGGGRPQGIALLVAGDRKGSPLQMGYLGAVEASPRRNYVALFVRTISTVAHFFRVGNCYISTKLPYHLTTLLPH